MSEEQKEENVKLQYINLTYIGKDFVRTFDKDGGGVTKSYKYKFKQTMDDQFSRNFWGYDNTKGVELLEDGKIFCIGYVKKPNLKGDQPLKIAKWFGEPQQDSNQQQPSAPVQAPAVSSNSQQTPLPSMQFNVKRFAEQFRDTDKIEMADKTLNRFISSFVKSTNKQQYIDLEELFNEVVHPKVDEPKPDFS